MSKQSNAAYIAGFMDGEGSFSITKHLAKTKQSSGNVTTNWRHAVQVTISNTNREVLEWIAGHFGGAIHVRKMYMVAKQGYSWKPSTYREGELFILAILPYLRIKRKQALVALSYYRMAGLRNPQQRESLRQHMLELNDSCKRPKPVTTNTPNVPMKSYADYPNVSADGLALMLRLSGTKIESDLTGDRESAPVVTQVPAINAGLA